MRVLLFALVMYISCGCNASARGVVTNDRKEYNSSYHLNLRSSIEFPLDEETNNLISYLQYADIDGKEYLILLNDLNNRIYCYDLEKSTNVKTFPSEGRYGLKIQGFCCLGMDSIFVYNYALADFQLHTNDDKVHDFILSRRDPEIPADYLPWPLASTGTPIYIRNSTIISTGCTADEFEQEPKRPVLILFDTQTKEEKYLCDYPPCYQQFNWLGSLFYRQPYYTLADQLAVISFPASHEVYSYDLKNDTYKARFAGSKEISKIYSYPISKKLFYKVSSSKEKEWYMTNASYEGIFYDKYREVYYRFARLPQPDFQTMRGNRKPTIVIILDKNLQYIGETRLPDDVYFIPSNSFVSAAGLNIQVMTDNEDQLLFYQYEISEVR